MRLLDRHHRTGINTKLLSKFWECLFFNHEKYEKTAFGMPMF